MDFPNSLNMSVVLVMAFVGLHFYESSVEKQYNAYNSVLGEIVKEKKYDIDHYTRFLRFSDEKTEKEEVEIKKINDDLKILYKLLDDRLSLKLTSSKAFIKKYNIDQDNLKIQGGISTLGQFSIVNSVSRQLESIFACAKTREKQIRQGNIHMIIMDRLESYQPYQSYDLELNLVDLYNSFPIENFVVEIDGIEREVLNFPVEINSKPNSIVFRGSLENKVTGEKHRINEIYRP